MQHVHSRAARIASAIFFVTGLVTWASESHARVEYIGQLNGQAVYLIWGPECSALDPPDNNVARGELCYTGPALVGAARVVGCDPRVRSEAHVAAAATEGLG